MKKISLLLLIACSVQIAFSQELDKVKLEQYFDALEANNKFMGSVAILKEGEIIYAKQVGFSDLESGTKPDKNTKYRIGSISKTFTSTLIFQAIEADEISLSTTIDSYFPTIEYSDKITIGNLLNHRSGIHNFKNDMKKYLKYHTTPKTKKEMMEIIAESGSDFEPNSKAAYSNSNYVLLTYILEDIHQKSFAKILDKNIIQPLNLKNTSFGGKIDLAKNESYSYAYEEGWKKQPETDTSIPLGAGGIISTPTDLALFAQALFTNKLVSENSLSQMKTLQDNYGMGLFQIPFYDKVSYGHTGGIDGFSSVLGYFENEKCAFSFTSNGANYETNNISIILLSNLFNKPYSIPSFEVYEVKPKDLDPYLGVYSSETFPLKITITKSGNTLMAQATGQPAFGLEATAKDRFKFDRAGIVMDFDPEKNEMAIKQGGTENVLTKE